MTAPALLATHRPYVHRTADVATVPGPVALLTAWLRALVRSRVARTALVLAVAGAAFALAMLHQTDPFGTPSAGHAATVHHAAARG